jgi:hypothetical protein
VTWITGLLAGDDQCQYAAWVKSHYTYEKRVRDDGFDLATWKAQHAALVERRAVQLVNTGWTQVMVEDQNKFTLRGQATTLAGVPDLVATKDGILVRVSDAKSGQRRAKDIWQVLLYLFVLPMYHRLAEGSRSIEGEVVYTDGVQYVDPLAADHRERIIRQIQVTGGSEEPKATPSARECGFCDIAECPFRVSADAPAVLTEAF